jgi:hypothetical protein
MTRSLVDVAKIGHVWVAGGVGGALFGVLLALGVVWGPKLLMVRGASESTAAMGSSMLWLGLAVGSAVVPWWSDRIRARKLPTVLGTVVQLVALSLLVYVSTPLAGCNRFPAINPHHFLMSSWYTTSVKLANPGPRPPPLP